MKDSFPFTGVKLLAVVADASRVAYPTLTGTGAPSFVVAYPVSVTVNTAVAVPFTGLVIFTSET